METMQCCKPILKFIINTSLFTNIRYTLHDLYTLTSFSPYHPLLLMSDPAADYFVNSSQRNTNAKFNCSLLLHLWM